MKYRQASTPEISPMSSSTRSCRACRPSAQKESAFRVIDTHAGAGLYDLTARRLCAARNGGRDRPFLDANIDPAARPLLADYPTPCRAAIRPEKIIRYPGSPLLVRAWLRRADRLVPASLSHPPPKPWRRAFMATAA